MSADTRGKPSITPTPDGPYLVKDLASFKNRKGSVETKSTMALCRCGESSNKPFCDGTHAKIGFSSAKLDGRLADRREDHAGAEITVHDNRGICAHAGRCTDGLPAVFRLKEEPFVDPSGASRDEIIADQIDAAAVTPLSCWAVDSDLRTERFLEKRPGRDRRIATHLRFARPPPAPG